MIAESVVPGPARGLAALLDLPTEPIVAGWTLPPLWHWVYLLEHPRQSDLGPEGHARQGIPKPPREGLRRMYAGGRVRTYRPLVVGEEVTGELEVVSTRERTGRSGWMSIVTTRRTVRQRGEVAITDEVDIIYREPTRLEISPGPPDEPGQELQPAGTEVTVDQAYLFRFSALTLNSHRIHYDVDYCRNEEDYPDLVVHGPLQGLLMSEAARQLEPAPASLFEYRLVAPLVLGQGLFVQTARADEKALTTLIQDRAGRTTAVGKLLDLEPA